MSKTAGERTFLFAKDVRKFVRKVPKDICNIEDSKQLIKASGSVGANYIEANEALSKKISNLELKYPGKKLKSLVIG